MTENSRRADAKRRQEMAQAAARQEAVSAKALIDEFVAVAQQRGLTPEPLQAVLINGTRVKSDQVGWYLNRSRTLAITPAGEFLKLLTAAPALARFTGVKLKPSPPPMYVGLGGRDGETGDLRDFLERMIADYGG